MKVVTALISVYDKTGVVEFAKSLSLLGVKILSSGGTSKVLSENSIKHTFIEDYTGSPEMLGGRVKTLHPKIHGGILAKRDDLEHEKHLSENDIPLIDLVVVNLYPFQKTVSDKDTTLAEALEQIDIGGPTLVRGAAKNFKDVGVVIDPADYDEVVEQIRDSGGLSDDLRKNLAVKAFAHTTEYDNAITNYLSCGDDCFPSAICNSLEKVGDLRYGENAHQKAAYYKEPAPGETCIPESKILQEGKGLSFNNILDLNAALELLKEFEKPAAVIVKHLNPSGVGVSDEIFESYMLAHKADALSAFGCVVAVNRPVTKKLAEQISKTFVEALVAPGYEEGAVEILSKKENMRLLDCGEIKPTSDKALDCRKIVGGMIIQTPDLKQISEDDLEVISKRKPTAVEIQSMLFAWKVCRHTKSNSIIFSKKDHTVGIGAGQMSRVDSVKIAGMKAGELSKGAAMASDAFFPFRDGIDEAAKVGITAVIHPGGSIRDQEVIDAVNEHGMTMVYTKTRCFLH